MSNDIKRTNVPDIRVGYRYDTLCDELRGLIPQPQYVSTSDVNSLAKQVQNQLVARKLKEATEENGEAELE